MWAEVSRRPETREDERLRELLYHAHSVHWAYLHIWHREPVDVPELASFESAEAIRAWGRAFYRQAPALLDRLDADALGRPVDVPWADHLVERFGKAEPVTLQETLLQVALHSTYHRGQINARLRALGGEPPLTDYVAWLWMSRPEPAWGSASGS